MPYKRAALSAFIILVNLTVDNANGFGLFPSGKLSPDTCSLSQPAPAAANSFNTQTLCEDFTTGSSIDGSHSMTAGFNWYLSTNGVNWVNQSDYTVSSSVFNLNNEQVPGGFAALSESASQITPTVITVGKSYAAPLYVEFKIAVNQSLAPGSAITGNCGSGPVSRYSWPTIWLNDINLNIAQFGGPAISSNKAEIDILEDYVGCSGMGAGVWTPLSNIHIWNTATTILTSNTNNVSWGSGTWDGVTFHTVGELITSSNAYTYFDGTLEQTIPLTGSFAVAATGTYNIIINPGVSWPIRVDYVQVWQP